LAKLKPVELSGRIELAYDGAYSAELPDLMSYDFCYCEVSGKSSCRLDVTREHSATPKARSHVFFQSQQVCDDGEFEYSSDWALRNEPPGGVVVSPQSGKPLRILESTINISSALFGVVPGAAPLQLVELLGSVSTIEGAPTVARLFDGDSIIHRLRSRYGRVDYFLSGTSYALERVELHKTKGDMWYGGEMVGDLPETVRGRSISKYPEVEMVEFHARLFDIQWSAKSENQQHPRSCRVHQLMTYANGMHVELRLHIFFEKWKTVDEVSDCVPNLMAPDGTRARLVTSPGILTVIKDGKPVKYFDRREVLAIDAAVVRLREEFGTGGLE
jgi:hypothetical protein